MKETISNLAEDNFFVGLSSLASVLGFIISCVTFVVAFKVNEKINKKIRKYVDVESFNNNRIEMRDKLKAYQLLIQKDKIVTVEIIMKIHNQIGEFENFSSIIHRKDKFNIWLIKKELKKELSQINKSKLGLYLSYFIRRCNKKEENFL